MKKLQLTHLVNSSPWPIMGAMSMMMIMMSTISMLHNKKIGLVIMSIMMSVNLFMMWSKDIFNESSMEGMHSKKTSTTLKAGMILFIMSEIFLFVSVFWAFFHASISPSVEIMMKWPPKNITPFNYEEIPMLNSIILVSSGATLTLSHHQMMMSNMKQASMYMMTTISLGLMFTTIQYIEYKNSLFSMNDSSYGALFFLSTGLHGMHVIVGTIFLMVVLVQMKELKSMPHQFNSFEMASWYWHFVDVVWLFLLTSVYWWGGL